MSVRIVQNVIVALFKSNGIVLNIAHETLATALCVRLKGVLQIQILQRSNTVQGTPVVTLSIASGHSRDKRLAPFFKSANTIHWREANYKCDTCNGLFSPVLKLNNLFTEQVPHPTIILLNDRTEVVPYIFQRSIGPNHIQSREIEQREISCNIPGHSTMVPGIPTMAGGSSRKVQNDQIIKRTRGGLIGNWRGQIERTWHSSVTT